MVKELLVLLEKDIIVKENDSQLKQYGNLVNIKMNVLKEKKLMKKKRNKENKRIVKIIFKNLLIKFIVI